MSVGELLAPIVARPAGTLALSAITVDGAPVAFAGVLADVTIRHGRTGYFESASASTAQVTLLGATRALTQSMRLGATLVIKATDGATEAPRFTGQMTDADLELDALTLIAVGALRTLGGFTVGTVDYPEEAWSARVTRAFTEAGIAALLELAAGALDPVLVARPADPVALDQYLGDLASMVDAAVGDRPNGDIFVQSVYARTSSGAVALDPAEVGYAPDWQLRLPDANIVTVSYGDPEASLTVRDDASVALYGPIPEEIATSVKSAVDASTIASKRLAANAYARWAIADAPLLWGRALAIGAPVKLSSLPPAAPHDPWAPILEGWTDRIVADGDALAWTMELALSDPLLSGLTMAWQDVPTTAAYQWNTINQTVAWKDALTLDALDP